MIGIGDLLLWLNKVCNKFVCLDLVGKLVEGLLCCILIIINGNFVIIVRFIVFDFR